MKCPVNSHYEICTTACPETCSNLAPPQGCEDFCKEGCVCDEGYILSGNLCVPFSQCGCMHNDRYYRIGEVFYPSGHCQDECKCTQDGEVMDNIVNILSLAKLFIPLQLNDNYKLQTKTTNYTVFFRYCLTGSAYTIVHAYNWRKEIQYVFLNIFKVKSILS